MKQLFINKFASASRIICLGALLSAFFLVGCDDNDKGYLVREDDSISFTNAPSSHSMTIRSNTSWKIQIPNEASWLTVSPMSGKGDGGYQNIEIKADRNRGEIREAIFDIIINEGNDPYPVKVLQDDGKIVYDQPSINGHLIEGQNSEAKLTLSYSKSVGDEKVKVSCEISGEGSEGLSVVPAEFLYTETKGELTLDIDGTPKNHGNVVFNIMVDGVKVASLSSNVLDKSTIPVEGLPAMWAFTEYQTAPGSDEKAAAKAALEAIQKATWMDNPRHYLIPTDGNATLEIIEARDKTATTLNSWGCNDGHAYVKGLFLNDYFLFTVPVKYLQEGTKLNLSGSIGGSGSSAGFFILEYSSDNINWTVAEGTQTKSHTINNEEIIVTYHVKAEDNLMLPAQINQDFIFPEAIGDGNLYVRLRVAANIRLTANNTITAGGGGSTRLKGIVKVSIVN